MKGEKHQSLTAVLKGVLDIDGKAPGRLAAGYRSTETVGTWRLNGDHRVVALVAFFGCKESNAAELRPTSRACDRGQGT